MNTKDFAKRILVAILSLVITITYMPAAVFAEPISDQKTTQSEAVNDIAAPSEESASEKSDAEETTAAENSDAEEAASQEESAATDEPAEADENDTFTREAEIDDVIVKVEAEAGVFPDDAELVVEKVSKKDEAKAAEAIDEVRPAELNVADSYTFDIKLVDAEGTELQPADDQKVNVTFNMARAADPNLSADIYHITENEVIDEKTKETEIVLEAEKLETETDAKEETVTAETDGFSFYRVEFSYGTLTYNVEIDAETGTLPIRTLLDEVGIEGDVTSVDVGTQYYFFYAGGNITFAAQFEGSLPLIVTVASPTYPIPTDYTIYVNYCREIVPVDSWTAMQNAVNDSNNNGKTIMLSQSIYAEGKDRILIKGKTLTIDLNGFAMDRQRTKNDSDGHVIEIQNSSNITIKNSNPVLTSGITGGYANNGGGIHVGKGCTCNLEDVRVVGNKADVDGGGIFVRGTLNMKGGEVSNNIAYDTGGGIYCTDTGTFNIENVTIKYNESMNDGGGLNIHLKSDATIKNCIISHNTSRTEDGGAIRFQESGETLNIIDTEISNNWAENDGGGITIYDGKVKMVGGCIKDNESENGGGVYNEDDIDFDGVEISGNTTYKKGGAGINNKDDAILKNCVIKNNSGKDDGGGVYSKDDITIKNCTFTGNSAAGSGGGIFIDEADLDLENCTLKKNYAGQFGAGLAIKDDTTDIKGTTVIGGNISYGTGGGIYVCDGATLNMQGDVRITGNSASNSGGGLGIGASTDNKVNLKGKIFISENEGYGPNVYFRSKTHPYSGARELPKLTLKEKLAEGSFIGLSVDYDIEGTSEVLTSGYKNHYGKADPTLYFSGDNETAVQTNSDGEVVLHTSAWPTLQKLINEAANNDEPLILEKNWKSSKYDPPLTIPAGKTLNLDLNGHTLDRKLSSEDQRDDGEIFNVENGRTLIIDDSTMKKTGKLIGANGKNGGAISVKEGGVLELKGGNLTANKAEKGGAVYNEGTVIISGEDAINAALYGNTAKQGGGIYNAGTLTVNCDAIRDNTANVGGGVYNAAGTLNLSGAISGNETDESAGGVFLADGSACNVSGAASITDNISAAGNNMFMAGGNTVINITDELADGTSFDVVAQNPNPKNDRKLTEGWEEYKGGCTFSYNGKVYDSSAADGKLKEKDGDLWLKGIDDTNIEWVSTWKELSFALRDEDNRKVIALKNDIKPTIKSGKGDDDRLYPLSVVDTSKIIDLCGFRLDSDGTIFESIITLDIRKRSSTLINVGAKSDMGFITPGELEIRDSVGTGMLTGGRATEDLAEEGSAIRIAKGSKCKLVDCAISGNKTYKNGGGIFNAGELEMIGGSVAGNSAPEGSGGGIFNAGKIKLNGVTISENNALLMGGGICIARDWDDDPGDSQITNCRIDSNKSRTAQGGGLYADMKGKTLTIEGSAIERNYVVHEEEIIWSPILKKYSYEMNNGGGIYLRAGTINMTGGTVSDNTSENGAGISNGGAKSGEDDKTDGGGTININSTKIDGNKTVGQVITEDNGEKSFGGLGAGIYNTNKLKLEDCTISNNKSVDNGGGVWTSTDNTIEVTDCNFEGNQAENDGGGVHLESGKLLITGSETAGAVFKDNEAYVDGGAVQVNGEIHIKGKVQAPNNAIFLPSGKKIKLDDALTPDSMIDVALEKDFGVFTDGYKDYHSDEEPEEYFCSDYGYSVFKTADNEAELKFVIDDGSHFIDMYNRVNDVSKLTKANWMSGISGDRTLNEINLPCTHDSAMKEVNYHKMSSIGSFLGYKGNAKTQVRYIDEQMKDGVRRLDIRLNNRHEKSYALGLWISYKDDGKNLWLCHGKTFIGGTFWAGNHDGDDLTFNETWEWVKKFLELHPTETIILDLSAEPVNSWGHDQDDDTETINERAEKLIRDFSKEINPSTGKPYVYWENGRVGSSMTRYPMLKECRGQAIFAGECEVGGLDDFSMGNTVATGEPAGEHGESADDKIRHTYEFYNKDNTERLRYIPTDVTEHLNLLYRVSALTAPLGLAGIPEDTPLNAADKIHQALYYSSNDDTGVFNQRGQYVGWIRQDGATARLNHVVWISNFPEDNDDTPDIDESLKYCTVTAESNISDSEAIAAGLDPKVVKTQTYKLLRGSEFPIPGDIYGYNKELSGWDATVPSGSEGSDAASFEPGDTYKIMDDVTFKANWGGDVPTPTEKTKLRVVWIDRNDEDKIRPESITVNYKKSGTEEAQEIEFPIADAWDTTIEGAVSEVTSVSDGGITIKPTDEHPHGQDKEGEYAYSIINNKLTGCIIVLYHTAGDSPEPGEDVLITGSIAWNDNNDAAGKRPEKVVVHLMKDDEYTGIQNEVSSATKWEWFFNLSSLGDYDPGASYSVTQEPVPNYSTKIAGRAATGFIITNSLIAEGHKHDLSEVKSKAATCMEAGNIRYWICDKGDEPCRRCFSDAEGKNEVDPTKTKDEGGIIVPATGHDWGKAVYEWADDNSTATGRCICNNDPDHKIEETVNTTSEVTKEPTETEAGERTYTASFKGDNPFEDQIKTELIPPTGKPEAGKHNITIDDGSGKGSKTVAYDEGSEVTIPSAPSDDKFFKQWKVKLYDGEGNEIADVTEDLFGKGGNMDEAATFTMPTSGESKYTTKDGEEKPYPAEFSLSIVASCEDRVKEATLNPTAPASGEELADMVHIAFDNGSWIDCPISWTYKDKAGKKDVVVPASDKAYNDTEYTATIHVYPDPDKNRAFAEAVKVLSNTGTPTATSFVRGEDGSLTISLTFAKTAPAGGEDRPVIPPDYRTITFKLGGGTYNGSKKDIVIKAEEGDVITVPAAPKRKGYKFLYWKGSKYYPGDKYTVKANHTMTAQWEKVGGSGSGSGGANTGDSNDALAWIAVMLTSMIALSGYVISRRRKNSR